MDIQLKNIETVALLAFYLLMVFFERRKFSTDKVELQRDIVSFVALAIFVNIARETVFQLQKFVHTETFWNLPGWVKIIGSIIIVDLLIYWIHRSMHWSSLLWKTHIWHHTPKELNQLSGFRTSFIHAFAYAIFQILIPFTIFNCNLMELGILFSYATFIQLWQHADFEFKGQKLVEYLFVTPRYHKIHHSSGKYMNYNISNTFTLWDRMFGTYADPDTTQIKAFGVNVQKKNVLRHLFGI